jgi:hypothetical protein
LPSDSGGFTSNIQSAGDALLLEFCEAVTGGIVAMAMICQFQQIHQN